jgi:hypothetical protein
MGGGGYDGKGDYTYIWTATEVSGSGAVFPPGGEGCEVGGILQHSITKRC